MIGSRVGLKLGWMLLALALESWAACPSTCLPDGTQSSGAIYRICMPPNTCYNGRLVVYAHGYVDASQPVGIPEGQLQLPDGTSIPEIINGLGFGFAMSSYSTNGLAVPQGLADSNDVVDIYSKVIGPPAKTYLTGPSEGGLITALGTERFPNIYSASVAACGPIGSFRNQIDYLGDFRVVFDYFFPGVIPGDPVNIPQEVMDDWDSVYVPAIQAAVTANPSAAQQVLKVTNAPAGSDANTMMETFINVLWYSAFTTNDATQKLGGQPYTNTGKIYHGSNDDLRLNLSVPRYTADPAAVQNMEQSYETVGNVVHPIVTMHTLGDPIIAYLLHEPPYREKVISQGAGALHLNLPINAYGHCNFTASQVLIAFGLMLLKDSQQQLPAGAEMLLPANQRQAFLAQARSLKIIQ